MLCKFSRGAVAKHHELGMSEQQKFIVSTVVDGRSLKSRCQHGHPPSESAREGSIQVCLSFCWFLGLSWFNFGDYMALFLCIQVSTFWNGTSHIELGDSLLQCDLILTKYIYNHTISK